MPPDAVDLMSKLLHINPMKRPSAEEALAHPYLADFHNERDEPESERILLLEVDDSLR
jgi:mitogen-activated protein kinase 15